MVAHEPSEPVYMPGSEYTNKVIEMVTGLERVITLSSELREVERSFADNMDAPDDERFAVMRFDEAMKCLTRAQGLLQDATGWTEVQ